MIIPHYYLTNKCRNNKDIINDKIKVSTILSKNKYKIINLIPHYYFIILFDSNNYRSRKSTFEMDNNYINYDYDISYI